MWLYSILFFTPVAFFFIGGDKFSQSKKFLAFYFCFLALFVGMSDMLGGYDRYIYGAHFDDISDRLRQGISVFDPSIAEIYEKGIVAIYCIIGSFTQNRYIFILCVTLLIYFNFYKAIQRHIKDYPFAIIIFLGFFFFFTFTYLRQCIGVSFAVLSIKYFIEKKRIKFFLMILLVTLMHKSGILFALIIFVPRIRIKPSIVVIFLILCLLIGLSGISSSIYETYGVISDYTITTGYVEDSGIRWAYIIEVLMFAGIILLNYDKLEETEQNNIFINMAFLFCATLLFFLRSSNGGRLSWYFMFGIIYTLSALVSKTELLSYRHRFNLAVLLLMISLFQYYRVFNNWQIYNFLYPYKTFLSNASKENDYLWQNYEYDHNYDKDRLYRKVFDPIIPTF